MADSPAAPPESKAALRHILAADPSPAPAPPAPTQRPQDLPTPAPPPAVEYAAPSSTSRKRTDRNDMAAPSKMRFLKKDDGTPFWRRDIQYKLLETIFDNDQKVFTKYSDGTPGHSFADVYIDAMARSSKCSNLLKEKLLSDTIDPNVIPARDMAMVCLLVNVGRMNTTVNFFPEMKARVRTFHSIPSLQARQGPSASKQLQDGPRLKSILKGCQEDTEQPITINQLYSAPKPRISPVSMVFMLAQFAPKISESHFRDGLEFFDIFMRDTLSSETRGKAFLWLCWWYLESGFTAEDSRNNPFGFGEPGPDPINTAQVPGFEAITEETAALENKDPPHEVEFGEQKRKEREENLASDSPPPLSGKKGKGTNGDKFSHMHVEPRTDSPQPETVSSERRRSELLSAPPQTPDHSTIDGNRSPRLAPAPRFTAANLQVPPTNGRQSPSSSPPRDMNLPKLRPNTSQHSNESANAQDSNGHETHRPSSVGRHASPHNASLNPSAQDQVMQRSPHYEHPHPPLASAYPHPPIHTPVAQPHHPHYPHAGSPYGPGYPHQNGQMHVPDQSVIPPPHPPSSAYADSRPPSNHPMQPQSVEQSRSERVGQVVRQSLEVMQRAKRHEYRRRGVVSDAWIKARSLPSGWDSEEDDFHRMGGIDDIRENGMALNVRVGEGNEMKRWDIGDVGQQAADLAKTCHRVGRTLSFIDQDRNSKRPKRKQKAKPQGPVLDGRQDMRRVSGRPSTSTFPAPPPTADQRAMQRPASISPRQAPANPASTFPASTFPAPPPIATFPPAEAARKGTKRRRKSSNIAPTDLPTPPPAISTAAPPTSGPTSGPATAYPTDPSQSQGARSGSQSAPRSDPRRDSQTDIALNSATSVTSDKATYSWTPKGRRRKDSDTYTPGSRPGEIGVPASIAFAPGEGETKVVIEAAGGPGRKRRSTLTRLEEEGPPDVSERKDSNTSSMRKDSEVSLAGGPVDGAESVAGAVGDRVDGVNTAEQTAG